MPFAKNVPICSAVQVTPKNVTVSAPITLCTAFVRAVVMPNKCCNSLVKNLEQNVAIVKLNMDEISDKTLFTSPRTTPNIRYISKITTIITSTIIPIISISYQKL